MLSIDLNGRRALVAGGEEDEDIVARMTDVYAALPAITGKIELEYEGELKGGDAVSRELIRAAVSNGNREPDADTAGPSLEPATQRGRRGRPRRCHKQATRASCARSRAEARTRA